MWARIGIGTALLLGVVVVTIPGWIRAHRDGPPIDDSDLAVERRALAPGTNGMPRLDEIGTALHWPEESEATLLAALDGEAYDATLVRDVLARNEAALARVPWALSAPAFQTGPFDPEQELAPGVEMRTLARLLGLRGILHAEAGDPAAALADVSLGIEVGQRVRDAEANTLISAVIGLVTIEEAMRPLAGPLRELSVDAATSKRIARRWHAARSDRERWSPLYHAEYAFLHTTMELGVQAEIRAETGRELEDLPGGGYLFQPNETRRLLAEHFRAIESQAGGPCYGLDIPIPEVPESRLDQLRLYLGPNSIGRILHAISAIDPTRYEQRRCNVDTALATASARLAMRAHARATGTTPPSIEALVPEYLDAVPRDGWTHEPLTLAVLDPSEAPD